jgi:hypothetical protein
MLSTTEISRLLIGIVFIMSWNKVSSLEASEVG